MIDKYFSVKQMLQGLSPQLQALINIELRQKQLESNIEKTQIQITDIKDTIVNREEDWRKEVGRKLRKIGLKHGDYKTFVDESYRLLQERARYKVKRDIHKHSQSALHKTCSIKRWWIWEFYLK